MITPATYKDYTPVQFMQSFISDIEVAEKSGLPINIKSFYGNEDMMPCLGGLAVMNMGLEPWQNKLAANVACLGDHIVRGEGRAVNYYLKLLYPGLPKRTYKEMPNMTKGVRLTRQYKKLKSRVWDYVKEVENQQQNDNSTNTKAA